MTYLLHSYENSVLLTLWSEEAIKNNEKIKNSNDDHCVLFMLLQE